MTSTWRIANPQDWDRISELSVLLNREDPGEVPRTGGRSIRATLAELLANPIRGAAEVFEVDFSVVGYALLISFWSNEFGGEICTIDELYVERAWRGRGAGSSLISVLRTPGNALWPGTPVALMLEAHRANTRSRALYARHGFEVDPNHHMILPLVADAAMRTN